MTTPHWANATDCLVPRPALTALVEVLDPLQIHDGIGQAALAKGLLDVLDQALHLVAHKAHVHGLKLLEHLAGDDVVHAAQLGAAARHVHGDKVVHLLDDTVAKGQLKAGLQVLVQLVHLLEQLVVDHVLDLGLLEQILQVVGRHVHALVRLALKRVGALVELDGNRAVVHLVRDPSNGSRSARKTRFPSVR